ncbi:MAG: DegT/DnrJ/EryC1/StrS family aminotransferase, partial [Betaproteobacteria bacterium]|nr:DegT/DnrJ/EryC1/StrS family aminotransferase [Betaproteobacteria bacterium]
MTETRKNIYVTEPFLPPLEDFIPQLTQIWNSRLLTNGGPFHEKFENELAAHLGVEHLSLFANGTLALITALQALRITGEVITTPYSFVATSHALLWNGLKPVFVDIDPTTRNLDPKRIEEAITPNTSAILAVHCYGIPCDTERIQRIADTYGLKIIYDAAHAFGVKQNDRSILLDGDLSILSFHATKVFNTFEGGAIICPDAKTKQRIDYLKNFGFADEVTVVAPGINGKMNEFSAALGLLQLQHIDEALARRAAIFQRYTENLKDAGGIEMISIPAGATWNYAYCPIYVKPEHPIPRDELYARMKKKN